MALNLPQRWWQIAWQADPNDPLGMRRWTDVSTMVGKWRQIARGRQYELARSLAGEPGVTFLDPDEKLNPANTSSPYYPYVQPYREILGQCMWPPTGEAGSTGNLINPDMWMPNDISPLDPSFEAYANGAAAPSALTAVGGTAATVTTTNPQQGTKSLTYTVASTTTRQGISWAVPCVPGQQYTTSAYVRQSAASTQVLLVGDQNLAWDDFETASVNGWDVAGSGQAWTTSGGTAGNYAKTGGWGTITLPTGDTAARNVLLPDTYTDIDWRCPVRVSAVATGANIVPRIRFRSTDDSNYYQMLVSFTPTGTVDVSLFRVLAGVALSLDSESTVATYTAGSEVNVHVQAIGPQLQAKVWAGDPAAPPDTWTVTATDASHPAGQVGVRAALTAGNTNTNPVVSYGDLTVTGSTASSTTATTGAYVRLSKTFTATQPAHTITMCTQGTAVAGTVNIDAVQHEPGASASAFTTAGPCIFPLLRDYVERWPRSNQEGTAGRAGMCDTRAVDGFAAMAAITLDHDYVAAVMGLLPDLYWRLNGGSGSSAAQETSGNQGPPLLPYDSKFGPGNPVDFGTPIEIAGAYGGSGVKFTPFDSSSLSTPDTILSLGRVTGSPQIRFPAEFTSTWSASIAAWVKCTESDPPSNMVIASPLALVSPIPTVPIYLTIVGDSPHAQIQSPNGSGLLTGSGSPNAKDGAPHLLVATITQVSGGNTTVKLYVDGVLDDTQTAATASIGGLFSSPCTVMNVGGAGINGGFVVNGVVAHVALWERELSSSDVTTLWTAGGLGHAGELSGTRLARRLASGGYSGATRISAGSTTMQPSTAGITDALTDGQAITVAEDGTLWIAPDGAAVMEGRQQRWLRLTPRGIFGEDEGAGEIPYLDNAEFDFDPSFVAADVRVSRVNGTTAIGGTAAAIATASKRYFPRSYTENSDFDTDVQAQYKADAVFASHRAPLLRVSQLTIDPSSNPALWKKALGIEVGQRWTVKRRAKGANGGVGFTQSEDFFIERVQHNEIDPTTGRWTITFLMSPIGLITSEPGVTLQPWILEHATYGVLDSTTVLGW